MNSADPRHFLYRTLDPDAARRLAAKHLSRHDDGELYLQYSASEAFGFDDGRLKTADYHSESGFGLRGVTGEMTAFAHANEISEAAIERAAATLQAARSGAGRAGPVAAAHQSGDVRRRGSAEPRPVRRQGRAVPADRCRGAGPRSASGPGQRQPRRELERDRHRPRRRVRRQRRPAPGSARRSDRRRAQRPPRDRLSWARRPLSLRPAVRGSGVEPRDRRGARARRWSTSTRSPRRPAKCRS